MFATVMAVVALGVVKLLVVILIGFGFAEPFFPAVA